MIKLKDKKNRQKSCLAIQEYLSNEKTYTDSSDLYPRVINNVNIYVGDSEEKILNNNYNLQANAGTAKYISLIDENITFVILNQKVHKMVLQFNL